MSFFTKKGDQLYLTGFLISSPIIVFKSDQSYILTSKLSANRLKT